MNTSKLARYTYPSTLEAQECMLKSHPQLMQMAISHDELVAYQPRITK